MKLTAFLLLGLVSATSATLFGWSWRWPGNGWIFGQKEECKCKSTRLTLDEKIYLLGQDDDDNKDGLITASDLYHSAEYFYDLNNDGVLSIRECVDVFSCRYGNTDYISEYICGIDTLPAGEPLVIANVDLNVPPFVQGLPLEQFLGGVRTQYERFYAERCVNEPLTVEQKLEINWGDNDFNNDGFATAEDFFDDLSNNYDFDRDGQVTKLEWVRRWICRYGDTTEFAVFVFNNINPDQPTIRVDLFNGQNVRFTKEEFQALNRQRYIDYRQLSASNYLQQNQW